MLFLLYTAKSFSYIDLGLRRALFCLNFDVAKDLEIIFCTIVTLLSRSMYTREIVICEQSMAANGVKNIQSSANPEKNFLVLSISGVLSLINCP